MVDFKILNINILNQEDDYISLKINFKFPESELPSFGNLNEYYKAPVVLEPEKLKEFYKNRDFSFRDFLIPCEDKPGFSMLNPDYPSPYKEGLIKVLDIQGQDSIHLEDDGTYSYTEFCHDCYIVRACLVQLVEMQTEIEKGICKFGDFPDQVGAFMSAEALRDFACILRSLDFYWH